MADKLEVQLRKSKSNLGSFISWERLEKQLRKAGEIGRNEQLTHIKADRNGIGYFVENTIKS